MKTKVILCYAGLVAATAAAFVTGRAEAGGCESPYQTTWLQTARCPGADSNLAFSQGMFAIPPSASASLRTNFQTSMPGDVGAYAYGFNNSNMIVGTPQCSGGSGAPGCVLCAAVDEDDGAGSEDYAPAGVCTQAKKHKLFLVWED
jgi:hypothetical protein